MKLGAIYTVFNGIELLKGSIEQIYKHVDEIIIVFQETSNRGNHDGQVYEKLKRLELDFKIHLVPFSPNMSINTKMNELNKHNVGLLAARKLGCTHFFLSATDHYYLPDEFCKAKVKAENYDITLTSMFTYYKKPTWQLVPIEDYYMPFICKIHPTTKYTYGQWSLPYRVDPSVRINTFAKHYLFSREEIMMHHYSMIRVDIENKFSNAAAGVRWGEKAKVFLSEYQNYSLEKNEGIQYFGGRKVQVVDNYFKMVL